MGVIVTSRNLALQRITWLTRVQELKREIDVLQNQYHYIDSDDVIAVKKRELQEAKAKVEQLYEPQQEEHPASPESRS